MARLICSFILCTVALAQMGQVDGIKALNLPLSFKICVVDFSLAREEKSIANAFGLKISGCTFKVSVSGEQIG